MPRTGDEYSLPSGTSATAITLANSSHVNARFADLAAEQNLVRPVSAGGTGASSAAGALVALGLTATAAELNILDGATVTTAELNILDGVTATAAELNVLDGIPPTLTATEIGYSDGVTSSIQTQLNAKQAGDATLTSLSGLSLSAGDLLYATAADTLVRLPKGTAGQVLAMNVGATAPEWVSSSGTGLPAVTTSGAGPFDFTVPSTATRIEIQFIGVSMSDTDNLLVQIGDSGGVETTGYVSGSRETATTSTSGFIAFLGNPNRAASGIMTLSRVADTNIWIESHAIYASTICNAGGGSKTLSDTITTVRITKDASAAFDAGSVAVRYW